MLQYASRDSRDSRVNHFCSLSLTGYIVLS